MKLKEFISMLTEECDVDFELLRQVSDSKLKNLIAFDDMNYDISHKQVLKITYHYRVWNDHDEVEDHPITSYFSVVDMIDIQNDSDKEAYALELLRMNRPPQFITNKIEPVLHSIEVIDACVIY